ncbi:major facilitator superfamily nucleoside/H(+) symporter [Candidatus Nitrosoglobus terrae]|uniref:Major facilitator superfamily nucleoside/H(+) symporter n=2 Tax=Candidatus Nitrosoglobus terrae TaxID=1630141 RepID=A0A1Q2SPE7_9GAMM|nr:major facilitator superfamily nucleoside/H(+) symporter [Candidatus Nitrosoglobus terrae]
MALLMAARILGPSLWDQVTNHSGRRMATIRLASLFATLTFSTVYFCQSYLALAVMIVAFGLSRNGILPQFEVVTLSYLDIAKQLHYYGRIRLWGSIGFILSVILLGPVLDRVNIHLLPTVILTLTMSIWILSLTIPESNAHNYHSSPHDSVWKILKSSEVLAFFTLAFLMQASHGPYNIFYTIYLEDYGYSRSLIGGLWALGVIAEVGIFLFMPRLLLRLGVRRILLGSLLLASLRWLLIGLFPVHLLVIIFAQLLHAATFGAFHAAAIDWVYHRFRGIHQGQGQTLYSSLGFGIGGAFGSFYSGHLWAINPSGTYFIAAAITVIAFFLAYFTIAESPASE